LPHLKLAALRNKAQKWVDEAIEEMRKRLPFELLGIDSDHGYCKNLVGVQN
jgi:hypothetical protein